MIALLFLASIIARASGVLTICGAPLPPYAFLDNGHPAGVDVTVAQAVFGRIGVPISIEIEPFARCQEALKIGAADVAFAVSNTANRQAYALFPKQPVWQIGYVFFTNPATKAAYEVNSLADAKRFNLGVGIVRGASYFDDFWATYPGQSSERNEGYNDTLVPAADTAANLRQLALGHVQLFAQDRIAGLWSARFAGLPRPPFYDTLLNRKDYPNAFSKASHFSNSRYADITAVMSAYELELARYKKSPEYHALFANLD
jgi:polar amino acid transport system substrate-binding protein